MSGAQREGRGLDFGRRTRSPGGPRVRVMAGVLAVVTLATWLVYRQQPPGVEPVVAVGELVVEVRGDVPVPGFYTLPEPVSVAAAVAAAGGDPLGLESASAAPLVPGSRVVVDGERARVEMMDDTLVVGVPVDINRASVAALQALPGVGPARAQAIVTLREQEGPFASIEGLSRVRGIGPKTVEALRPFVEVRAPSP